MKKIFSFAGLSTVASSTFAAVPTEVTTAIADGKADMLTVAAAMLGVLIALVAFKLMRKAL